MSEQKTLNQKIEELNDNAEWFYSDDFNLDEAVAKYKEAIKLAQELKKDLDEVKNEVEVLSEDFSK
ncbi:exodeoxyribonuclease VII small subunit [Candidatus Saccharibacteria bacterium]|nr:exodeoxyribonuclease VII small subunit [Candidatus Saccharibacteria bacterium]